MRDYTSVPSLVPLLRDQIAGLARSFPHFPEIQDVFLTGSCVRGAATYRSDVDLLVVLRDGPLDYRRVRQVRDRIEEAFSASGHAGLLAHPLPVQLTVVLATVFQTQEPAMREALRTARALGQEAA